MTQGFLMMNNGSKEIITPNKPAFAGKGTTPPRAFEAVEWTEQGSPDMSDMLQDMFREWAKGKPDDTPPQESPYHAMAASVMPPAPPPPPHTSPVAELQERWRLQSQSRNEVREGNWQ